MKMEVDSQAGAAAPSLDHAEGSSAWATARRIALSLTPLWLASVLAVPTLVWIARDRSIWPWDPSWYGQVSIDLWSTLRLTPSEWPTLLAHAFAAKPPAIAWFGEFFVPFGHKLGSIEKALLVSVVCCEVVVLVLIWVAARRLARGAWPPALVALLLTAAAPLFISMGHEYFVEPIQSVAVAWALLTMVSASRWGPGLTLANGVGAAAFGLLTKLSTPVYMAAPLGVALFLAFRAGRKARNGPSLSERKLVGAWVLAVLLSVGAAAWYQVNFDAARAHLDAASQPGLYGVNEPFFASLHQWFDRLWDVAFLPHVWIVAAVALVAGWAWAAVSGSLDRTFARLEPVLEVAACLFTIALVLVLFARHPNNEVRYLLPLLPSVALVVVGLSAPLQRRASALVGVAAATFGAAFVLGNLQALGAISGPKLTYVRLPTPAQPSFAHELRDIVRTTCTAQSAFKINMVGGEFPWLNANTLSMIADEEFGLIGRKCYYTSLGYAEQDPAKAWQRVQDFKPPYYIVLDYGNGSNRLPADILRTATLDDAFNRVNRAVYRRVRSSAQFAIVPRSRDAGVIVWRNRALR
jgi:hypothetical protein